MDNKIKLIKENFRTEKGVEKFIKKNKFLMPLLLEAKEKIAEHFTGAPLGLELLDDEGCYSLYLYITMPIKTTPKEVFKLINKFDEAWWAANIRRSKNKLCIDATWR